MKSARELVEQASEATASVPPPIKKPRHTLATSAPTSSSSAGQLRPWTSTEVVVMDQDGESSAPPRTAQGRPSASSSSTSLGVGATDLSVLLSVVGGAGTASRFTKANAASPPIRVEQQYAQHFADQQAFLTSAVSDCYGGSAASLADLVIKALGLPPGTPEAHCLVSQAACLIPPAAAQLLASRLLDAAPVLLCPVTPMTTVLGRLQQVSLGSRGFSAPPAAVAAKAPTDAASARAEVSSVVAAVNDQLDLVADANGDPRNAGLMRFLTRPFLYRLIDVTEALASAASASGQAPLFVRTPGTNSGKSFQRVYPTLLRLAASGVLITQPSDGLAALLRAASGSDCPFYQEPTQARGTVNLLPMPGEASTSQKRKSLQFSTQPARAAQAQQPVRPAAAAKHPRPTRWDRRESGVPPPLPPQTSDAAVPQPPPAGAAAVQAGAASSATIPTCFSCKQPGHMQRNCPRTRPH
jgi:hypothetical protein